MKEPSIYELATHRYKGLKLITLCDPKGEITMFKNFKKSFHEFQERRTNPFGLTNEELKKIGFSSVEEEKPIYTQSEVDAIRLRAKQDGFAAGLMTSAVTWLANKAVTKIVEKLQKAE